MKPFEKFDCTLLVDITVGDDGYNFVVQKGDVVKGFRTPPGHVYLESPHGGIMMVGAKLNTHFTVDPNIEKELKKPNPFVSVGQGVWKPKGP